MRNSPFVVGVVTIDCSSPIMREGLRHFYKGSMRFISEANMACETMDDLLESISYQKALWENESNDTLLVAKMKGFGSDVKLTLQGLSLRHSSQDHTSPIEYDFNPQGPSRIGWCMR